MRLAVDNCGRLPITYDCNVRMRMCRFQPYEPLCMHTPAPCRDVDRALRRIGLGRAGPHLPQVAPLTGAGDPARRNRGSVGKEQGRGDAGGPRPGNGRIIAEAMDGNGVDQARRR